MTTTWSPQPGRPPEWSARDHPPYDAPHPDGLPAWARGPRPGVHAGLRQAAQVGLAVAAAVGLAAVLWPPVLPDAGAPTVDLFGDVVQPAPDTAAVAGAYLLSWASAALAARLVATLLVGLWLLRVASGPQVDRGELRRDPGWALGAWLVPVVSYWWPMQVVRDLWWATVPATRRPDLGVPGARPVPVLVGTWWAVWLAADVTGLVARAMGRGAGPVDELQHWWTVDRVSTGLWAASAVLLLAVLHRLGRRVGSLRPG